MNYVHRASCLLDAASFRFYRYSLPQVKVSDPNIGCGHQIKLINEWVLRRALYREQNASMNLIEVRKVCGKNDVRSDAAAKEAVVPSKEDETFVVMAIAAYKVNIYVDDRVF